MPSRARRRSSAPSLLLPSVELVVRTCASASPSASSHSDLCFTQISFRVGHELAEGTKAMTAHENTAGHTSSAANRPFIAYMRSANARPRTELLVVTVLSFYTPPTTSTPIRFLRCRGLSMSLEKSRGRRGSVNFARSARAFDESAGPPAVRLLAASLAALVLIRE
jgi:hypothetical protein